MTKINDIFLAYLNRIFEKARSGVREESYYPVLEDFLREVGAIKNKKLQVDSFPKQTEAGNPDIRILNGQGRLVGYIEAKPLEKEALETVEDLEQLERYRKTFPNLILTNFLEFRLYRNGELLGKPIKISDLHPFLGRKFENIPAQNTDQLVRLLEQFFSFTTPRIYTAKALAIELARKTRFLRDEIIEQELIREREEEKKPLFGFYQAFKEYLIASLTEKDFADLYAQTIAYGLFIARHRYEMKPTLFEQEKEAIQFTRDQAYKFIQPSLGILREVFKFISSEEPSKQLRVMVDDIADLLAAADLEKVVKSFHKDGSKRDPIIHFYETFLAEYDPEEREKRGVYYTPEPVVSYIVKSIHYLLKEKFGKEDGLGTSSVTVLDPAAGTLTFPAKAIMLATDEYKKKYGTGGLKKFIKEHILENFYAFELMMAPYAIGHLKIDFVLELLGYRLEENERFKLYLTNTLEFQDLAQTEIPTVAPLAKESKLAGKVKREVPILVVIGNPPYSGISENKGEWILKEIKEYLQIEGESLKERKHWLQDDYVKFFRFAQWKIEQTGVGILGFITNHAWLDNPTFRGMRYSLLKTFDEIYILNLHGSTLKKEKTPEGGKDENVFNIRPGVAISILVKCKGKKAKKVFYADRWGLREEKDSWLERNEILSTDWQSISPDKPFYFLVPEKEEGRQDYQKFISVQEIFPVNSTGIVTARDEFVIDHNRQSLESKIRVFLDPNNSDDYIKEFLKGILGRKEINDVENYAWRVSQARHELKQVKNWEDYFTRILYRPFDERWIYYHPLVVWRTRENVMKHMLKRNLSIVTCRQQSTSGFQHVLVSNIIIDDSLVSNKTRERGYAFPLYIYHDSGQQNLLENNHKSPNLEWDNLPPSYSTIQPFTSLRSDNFIQPAEAIFYYVYAILYSNVYREKYKEFLRTDFPRIPFTENYNLLIAISQLGELLVNLHLLKGRELDKPIAKFYGRDDNLVAKVEYNEKRKRIHINNFQYFENIEPQAWNYYIGGYQVLNKWLKDRKDRTLSSEDIKHYCKVVTAISKTIEIQKEIDKLYSEVEKNLI